MGGERSGNEGVGGITETKVKERGIGLGMRKNVYEGENRRRGKETAWPPSSSAPFVS